MSQCKQCGSNIDISNLIKQTITLTQPQDDLVVQIDGNTIECDCKKVHLVGNGGKLIEIDTLFNFA